MEVGPPLPRNRPRFEPAQEESEGAAYTQVVAGFFHTVLLRSDGVAVACGENAEGQCDIPAPIVGAAYFVPNPGIVAPPPDTVVQLFIEAAGWGPLGATMKAVCRDLGGEQLASWIVPDKASCVKRDIDNTLAQGGRKFGVVLPDGRLLTPQLTWYHLMAA